MFHIAILLLVIVSTIDGISFEVVFYCLICLDLAGKTD